MEYEEVRLLKQSEKSTVHLLREKGGEQMYIRKKLDGQHSIYQTLQNCPHPCLPRLYEVTIAEDSTTVIEEYIEGHTSGAEELTEKQFLHIVRELCSVLEFLHGKGIIHRDIKPSNIILTEEGGVYLIDFDAARMPKAEAEQDTQLLGTRGYAPPEQYGFAQTDERTDIYALGATLEQLLPEKSGKVRYKKIIRKCMNLNPDERYQSVRQVSQAFWRTGRIVPGSFAAAFLLAFITCFVWGG
ncbi:MAG: serine/threonine protein kinase [Butyrivibrio sp.]|nr:serine/threonine protein kinase [Butyrivibrio sp.]